MTWPLLAGVFVAAFAGSWLAQWASRRWQHDRILELVNDADRLQGALDVALTEWRETMVRDEAVVAAALGNLRGGE